MKNIKTLAFALIAVYFPLNSLAEIVCRTDSNSLSDELIITQQSTGKYRAEILNRLIVANLREQASRSMGMKISNKSCKVKIMNNGVLRLDNLTNLSSNYFSRENCPYFVREDNGLRIIFPYLHMISAHRSEVIEMANWKFNECN